MNIFNVGFCLASVELDIRHFCSLPAFCSFNFFRPSFLRLLRSCRWWLETSENWEPFTKRNGVTYRNPWIIKAMISDLADLFNIGQMLDVERDSMEQQFYRNENLEGKE